MSNNQLLYIIESDDFSINELNFNGIDMTDPALQGYIDGVYAKSALLMEADQEGVVSHEYLEVIANSQLDAAASEKMIAYCAAYPEIGVDELTKKVQSEVTLNEEIQRLEAEEQAEKANIALLKDDYVDNVEDAVQRGDVSQAGDVYAEESEAIEEAINNNSIELDL